MTITVNIQLAQDQFNRLEHKLSNMRPVLAGIANMMLDAVERNFATETDPETGLKWTPLAASTQRQRARKGKSGKILQVTGNLAASITPQYGNDYALVSTNKVYAPIHQFGGKAGRGHAANIPARPYLALSKQDERDINDTVSDYLAHGLT